MKFLNLFKKKDEVKEEKEVEYGNMGNSTYIKDYWEIDEGFINEIARGNVLLRNTYRWNKDNWKRFLDNAMEDIAPGFLGVITVYNDNQKYEIVDGNQRLLTAWIFMLALYNYYYDKVYKYEDYFFEDIFLKYIIHKDIIDDSSSKYVIHFNNSEDKENIKYLLNDEGFDRKEIKSDKLNKIKEDNSNDLINQAYEFFYNEFSKYDSKLILNRLKTYQKELNFKKIGVFVVIDSEIAIEKVSKILGNS